MCYGASEFSLCKGAAVTDPIADIIARLDTLEAHVAGQEQVIAELNEMVTTQWQKIDRLERFVGQLRETVQTLTPARDGPEPPPPHY